MILYHKLIHILTRTFYTFQFLSAKLTLGFGEVICKTGTDADNEYITSRESLRVIVTYRSRTTGHTSEMHSLTSQTPGKLMAPQLPLVTAWQDSITIFYSSMFLATIYLSEIGMCAFLVDAGQNPKIAIGPELS